MSKLELLNFFESLFFVSIFIFSGFLLIKIKKKIKNFFFTFLLFLFIFNIISFISLRIIFSEQFLFMHSKFPCQKEKTISGFIHRDTVEINKYLLRYIIYGKDYHAVTKNYDLHIDERISSIRKFFIFLSFFLILSVFIVILLFFHLKSKQFKIGIKFSFILWSFINSFICIFLDFISEENFFKIQKFFIIYLKKISFFNKFFDLFNKFFIFFDVFYILYFFVLNILIGIFLLIINHFLNWS